MDEAAYRQAIKGRDRRHMRYSHGAALYNGDHVISVAHNRPLRHGKFSIHAEDAVVRKIPKHINRRKLVIVVIRVNNFGRLRNSKPCEECQYYLRRAGIRRVLYSGDDEQMHELVIR